MSTVSVAEIHCMICGTRRYGDEAERIITEALERIAFIESTEQRDRQREQARNAERREAEALARWNAGRAVQPTSPPKVNRLPRDEVVAAARRIASREDLMPTDGPSEPHTIPVVEPPPPPPPVEPKYEFDVAATPLKVVRASARASRVAALGGDDSTLCASPWCCNKHLSDRRYCSKACSDDVARARYKARKGKAP